MNFSSDRKKNNFYILRIFAALLVIYSHSYALAGFDEKRVIFQTESDLHLGV